MGFTTGISTKFFFFTIMFGLYSVSKNSKIIQTFMVSEIVRPKMGLIDPIQNLKGDGVFFVTARKQFAENAYKSCHVYKVIVVLHIYSKILGIRLVVHPANKNKSVILIKF